MQHWVHRVTVSDMSGQQDDNPRWVLTEPGVVVKVESGTVTGLVVYGHISGERLRQIAVGRLDMIDTRRTQAPAEIRTRKGRLVPLRAADAFPEWFQEAPPTATEVRAAETVFIEKAGRKVISVRRVGSETVDELIRTEGARRDGESAEAFYRRFAELVKTITPLVKSPNQSIATVLEISPNTVKQYVHRCRSLGYLPESRRRKSP